MLNMLTIDADRPVSEHNVCDCAKCSRLSSILYLVALFSGLSDVDAHVVDGESRRAAAPGRTHRVGA